MVREQQNSFATMFIGAKDHFQAREVARHLATSPLVKTAFFAQDANWGRIVARIGQTGVATDELDLSIQGEKVVHVGKLNDKYQQLRLDDQLTKETIDIKVDLHHGDSYYWIWGNDLSYRYIEINANYRS